MGVKLHRCLLVDRGRGQLVKRGTLLCIEKANKSIQKANRFKLEDDILLYQASVYLSVMQVWN